MPARAGAARGRSRRRPRRRGNFGETGVSARRGYRESRRWGFQCHAKLSHRARAGGSSEAAVYVPSPFITTRGLEVGEERVTPRRSRGGEVARSHTRAYIVTPADAKRASR